MTSIGENGSENSHSGEEAPGVRRAKRFKASAYVILCLSIISALTCGAALAALATHGRGNDSSEFEVFAITGVAFIVLGVLAGYAFAASARIDRRARGIEEPPKMGIIDGLRYKSPRD